MSKSDKKTKTPPAKRNLELDRAKALHLASSATRLLEEKYFDKLSKAITEKDWQLFWKTCEEAKVPLEEAKILWKITAPEPPIPGEVPEHRIATSGW